MPVEKYCIGMLARDMPADYEKSIEGTGNAHPDRSIPHDSGSRRDGTLPEEAVDEFWTEKQMKMAWGMRYAENYRKLKNALESTDKCCSMETIWAMTPFFNLSNGYTRDAKEVLGKEEILI